MRELDARVAEAMGRRRPGPGDLTCNWFDPHGEKCPGGVPAYSTSPEGLMAMLEFHAGAGRLVKIEYSIARKCWYATVESIQSIFDMTAQENGATPGEAPAKATVAWAASRKEAR